MILIIEDDEDTREAYQGFLELHGFESTTASTGAEALAIARAHAVEAVLLDVTLPDADGRTLSEHLRQAAAPRSLPILALTGHRLDRNDAARFTNVMQKPVDLDAMIEWVRGVLSTPTARSGNP